MRADMKESVFDRYFVEGWRPFFWITALAAALYARSLAFGYTFLDDNVLILCNQGFLGDLSNIASAFSRTVFAGSRLPYYRPLLMISFIIDAQFGGANLLVYHIANIALHAMAASLVFMLLARLGYERWKAFLFGAIFTVHPALSQGVAWIPGRNDMMLAVFALASFIYLLKFLGEGRPSCYIAHAALLLGALFTKETAVVIVALAAFYMYAVRKERPFSGRALALWAGWAACLAVWFLLRRSAIKGASDVTIVEAGQLVWMYLPAALQFLGKIFFPFNLSVFPVIRDTTNLYGAAAAALVLFLVIRTKDKAYPMILFGAAWAAAFILPSLIRANSRISADFLEHRVYVSIVGIFIVLLETGLLKNAKKRIAVPAAALLAAVFAAVTYFHMAGFAGRFEFWGEAVRKSPSSPFAHLAMARAWLDNGRFDEAGAEFKKCLSLDPLEPSSFFGLGEIAVGKGRLDEALGYFRRTIAVHPFYDSAHVEAGAVCYKTGRAHEAEEHWLRALEINPSCVAAAKFLAILYGERKDYEKAKLYARRLRSLGLEPPEGFRKSIGMD
jgi:tetratricopeptide (TPR) repeat protein